MDVGMGQGRHRRGWDSHVWSRRGRSSRSGMAWHGMAWHAILASICFLFHNLTLAIHFLSLSLLFWHVRLRLPAFSHYIRPIKSWPMHHAKVTSNYPWLPHHMDPSLPVPEDHINQPIQPLGDIQSRYKKYMKDCFDYYQAKGHKGIRCTQTEQDRIDMSLRQPQSMRNYTKMGFTKIRAPDHVFALLQSFWAKNKDRRKLEQWPPGIKKV